MFAYNLLRQKYNCEVYHLTKHQDYFIVKPWSCRVLIFWFIFFHTSELSSLAFVKSGLGAKEAVSTAPNWIASIFQ